MHLQNIACAVFAIKGMEKRVAVVLVGVYVLPHWHQTVFWYGNGGQGKNGCSLRLCLDIGQGLYSRLSFSPSRLFSFYSFSHRPVHVLYWHGDLSPPPPCYSIPGVTVDLFYQQCPWHFEPILTVQVFFPVYSQTFQGKVYIFKSWMTVLSFNGSFFSELFGLASLPSCVFHMQHSSLLCQWNHKNMSLSPTGSLKRYPVWSYPLLFDFSLIVIIVQNSCHHCALATTLLVIQKNYSLSPAK